MKKEALFFFQFGAAKRQSKPGGNNVKVRGVHGIPWGLVLQWHAVVRDPGQTEGVGTGPVDKRK